jgi:hypothetical protein
MRAVALYLLTAVVTGTHAFWLASGMIWGAPPNPLHYLSFAGSILLFIAALRAPSSARTSAKIGLAGSLAAWCLFAPLILAQALMPFSAGQEIQMLASSREYVSLVGMFGGPILLAVTTAYTIFVLKHSPRSA